ncbi:response regulator [Piscinibacter terrae]|uniref:Response regulator n=1 Tax=Piscinibacter terrae TaxID=2496871 RepID=A0A3N7HIF2_9BURK|nr:response regulator [Albitalea terrae]RQP21827.1 response regulator [Albitalea terrae]
MNQQRSSKDFVPDLPAGCRVLLAEDDESNALWAEGALRHLRCQIVSVRDGAAAVEAAKAMPFDVILMDYHMPVMDGQTATRVIRALQTATHSPRVPIIGVTASAMPAECQGCLDAGMDEVLVKPFYVADLQKVLFRWMPFTTAS